MIQQKKLYRISVQKCFGTVQRQVSLLTLTETLIGYYPVNVNLNATKEDETFEG
jgi:hypothetical protein